MKDVELRLGRKVVVELPFPEFERWVRGGRVPAWLPMRYRAVTGERWVQAHDLELYRILTEDRSGQVRHGFGLYRFPWLTFAFVVLTGLLALLPGAAAEAVRTLAEKDVGQIMERAQWWRLLSYAFVHVSRVHWLIGVVLTGYLGWLVENAYGRAAATLIAVAAILGGSLLGTVFFVGPTLGCSGLVFGLFGAVLVFVWKYEELVRDWHKGRFGWMVLPYLAALVVLAYRVPGIDNWTHLGGFVAGGLTALLVPSAWAQTFAAGRSSGRIWLALSAAVPLLLVGIGPFLGGPGRGGPLPPLSLIENREDGYSLKLPTYWMEGQDFLGFDIMRSPSNEVVFGHSMLLHKDAPSGSVARNLAAELADVEELYVDEDSLSEHPRTVAGLPASEGCLVFYRGKEGHRMCRLALLRGRTELQVSLRVPVGLERAYTSLWERILNTVKVEEPGPLQRAREQVAAHPQKWTAHLDLADELSAIGDTAGAWQSALQAKQLQPDDPAPTKLVLRSAIERQLYNEEALELARQAVIDFDNDPQIALAAEQLLAAAGHQGEALAILLAARSRFPVFEGLAERRSYEPPETNTEIPVEPLKELPPDSGGPLPQ